MMFLAKVEFVYDMSHIQMCWGFALHFCLRIMVEVSVAANVEVTRNLLDCEGSDQSTTMLVFEGLANYLKLFDGVGFPQKFEAFRIEVVALTVESPFFN